MTADPFSTDAMAQPKIKRKSGGSVKASMLPNQQAIPCLFLVLLALVVIALVLFFGLRSAS
jgi:hypothetical protein